MLYRSTRRNNNMRQRTVILAFVIVALLAAPVFAKENQNQASLGATLKINLTVVQALRLVLATGTSGTDCTVNDPGTGADYDMNFGNVNGLGVAAGGCAGVELVSGTPVWYSGYKVTPSFTGNTTSSAGTLKVKISTNFPAGFIGYLDVREADTAVNLTTALTTSDTTITSAAVSGTTLNRFLGIGVAPNNGAATSAGATSVTLTYTLTAP
jgi:hypothetical protein